MTALLRNTGQWDFRGRAALKLARLPGLTGSSPSAPGGTAGPGGSSWVLSSPPRGLSVSLPQLLHHLVPGRLAWAAYSPGSRATGSSPSPLAAGGLPLLDPWACSKSHRQQVLESEAPVRTEVGLLRLTLQAPAHATLSSTFSSTPLSTGFLKPRMHFNKFLLDSRPLLNMVGSLPPGSRGDSYSTFAFPGERLTDIKNPSWNEWDSMQRTTPGRAWRLLTQHGAPAEATGHLSEALHCHLETDRCPSSTGFSRVAEEIASVALPVR